MTGKSWTLNEWLAPGLSSQRMIVFLKIIIMNNTYVAQIPCEYDQMRVTNKCDTD